MATSSTANNNNKGTWSEEEHALLVSAVERYGTDTADAWHDIQRHVGTRSLKQVKERFRLKLDGAFSCREWTREEDAALLACVERYGPKWATIARELHGRNENVIKTRYHALKRKEDKVWTAEEDDLVRILLIDNNGQIADIAAEHFPRKTVSMVTVRRDLLLMQKTADDIKRRLQQEGSEGAVEAPPLPPPAAAQVAAVNPPVAAAAATPGLAAALRTPPLATPPQLTLLFPGQHHHFHHLHPHHPQFPHSPLHLPTLDDAFLTLLRNGGPLAASAAAGHSPSTPQSYAPPPPAPVLDELRSPIMRNLRFNFDAQVTANATPALSSPPTPAAAAAPSATTTANDQNDANKRPRVLSFIEY